jgi:hypothetical protein
MGSLGFMNIGYAYMFQVRNGSMLSKKHLSESPNDDS